jgi:fatty acid desaturase
MNTQDRDTLIEAHRARWKTFWIWLSFLTALVLGEVLLAWSVSNGHAILAMLATLLVAHFMHSQLLAFHEAAHGVLCPNWWVNELIGLLIGKYHLNGLSLFRAVHHTHHAYLATEKDEQLWPFVNPRAPRWARRVAAACELSLGMLYDLVEFWRAFLRPGSPVQNPKVRGRVWAELGLTVGFWTLVLTAVAWWGVWRWLLLLYVVPALIAGNMHSLRKYIEHMGLMGSTVLGLTRTVVPSGPLSRLLAFTMFNVSYHSVHHYYARMPQASLPRFAVELEPQAPEEHTVYPSYWMAFLAMLPTLADPKTGPQWSQCRAKTEQSIVDTVELTSSR